jgi:hypothetical protein
MTVDSRWVGGGGYRPVRVSVTPTRPVKADRTLMLEFLLRRGWHYRYEGDRFRVVQFVEIPAGSRVGQPIEATVSIPQTSGWDEYEVNVFEDGKLESGLCHVGSMGVGPDWQLEEALPRMLFVGVGSPDTRGIASALGPIEESGYVLPLPTAIARRISELPARWIDYTNLDVVCLSMRQAAALKAGRPEAFAAVLQWTRAGGNLWVYAVGEGFSDLTELETLVGLRQEGGREAGDPSARGWGVPEPPQTVRPLRATDRFALRTFGMGRLAAIVDEDPFAASGNFPWSRLLSSVDANRYLGCNRHGLSPIGESEEFWNFLIPGVGLPPVMGFRILITLFVLAIGPLNYFLLRRWKRLHLLVVTVPVGAAAVTFLLFGYALLADGLGTRVRVRSVTQIDQRAGHAACWARLSYYAGLAPSGGLRFPSDVAVMPLDYLPLEVRTYGRELKWEDDQWLSDGWISSRTPMQLVTLRSRPSARGLSITEPEGQSGTLTVENGLGTAVRQLLIRAKDGRYFWTDDLDAGASAVADAVQLADAQTRLGATFQSHAPALPPGLTYAGRRWSRRRGYYDYPSYGRSSDWGLSESTQRTGLLETLLAAARAARLEPGSYVAVVEQSPEVVLGTPSAREEGSLNVVLGQW